MAHEVLSAKLDQLDGRMNRLHRCIHLCERGCNEQLRQEMDHLRAECEREQNTLQNNLQQSKSDLTALLARSYGQIEEILQQSRTQLQTLTDRALGEESVGENKILLAEYALDFAYQAADRALLLAMEAIETQVCPQKEGVYDERN